MAIPKSQIIYKSWNGKRRCVLTRNEANSLYSLYMGELGKEEKIAQGVDLAVVNKKLEKIILEDMEEPLKSKNAK